MQKVYVATRLFDLGSRIAGCHIEKAVANGIRKASIRDSGLRTVSTFLPYRDSNERADSLSGKSLSNAIYRIDRQMLDSSLLLVAPLHDMCHDSGIAYELGYAYGRRIPAIGVTSNFCSFRYPRFKGRYPCDPLLLHMCTSIIAAPPAILRARDATRGGYLPRMKRDLAHLCGRLEAEVSLRLHRVRRDVGPIPISRRSLRTIHLEFGGCRSESQMILAERVRSALSRLGLVVTISRRYRSRLLASGIRQDLMRVRSAGLVVTLGDGEDMDSGSAAMHGFRTARGGDVVLYCTDRKRLTAGRGYDTARNLMLCESAVATVSSLSELTGAIRASCLLPS